MTDTPIIDTHGLVKVDTMGATEVRALRGVDVKVAAGEFVAVMGASGSGKSTLMNILGCLDRPSSGRYVLDGTDVSRFDKRTLAAMRNRMLGFVFQGFNLLARTTALENITLPTLYTPIDRDERKRRARRALELVGRSRQPRMFISVDLPEPEAPMIAVKEPCSMVKLTPARARTSTSPIR